MKKATLIAIVVTLSTVMFAGVNVTWGNTYADDGAGTLTSSSIFGVWFDVNDATSVGWENGLKVGVAGPSDTSLRLGYDSGTTLGVGWNYDFGGGGTGWGTTLGTAIDFGLTDVAASCSDGASVDLAACNAAAETWDVGATQGDFNISVTLGFGF
jgi:hypothetical protein